jgi:hypothetical protein
LIPQGGNNPVLGSGKEHDEPEFLFDRKIRLYNGNIEATPVYVNGETGRRRPHTNGQIAAGSAVSFFRCMGNILYKATREYYMIVGARVETSLLIFDDVRAAWYYYRMRRCSMRRLIPVVLLVLLSGTAYANEFFANAGVTRDIETSTARLQWSATYLQEIGEHAAFSFSYVNEGHQVNHYRDGIAGQLWARAGVWNRNLVFGLGAGPYVFFDTHTDANGAFHNEHGLAALFSGAATLYSLSPLLLQVRINYLESEQSFDTLSGTIGIGYELGTNKTPTGKPGGQGVGGLHNEITAYGGTTVLNTRKNEQGTSWALEYRRTLATYIDWTAMGLYEGGNRPVARYGLMSQLWLAHPFFADHLTLGVGFGPYLAHDKYAQGTEDRTKLDWAASFSASVRFLERFALRGSWSRVITEHDRDTDVFLAGLSYRF